MSYVAQHGSLRAQMKLPFARNVFNCCNHFTYSLWFLTPAYIFQLFMSSVDRCSHERAQILLKLLSISAGVCSFNTDSFANDMNTFNEFIAAVN